MRRGRLTFDIDLHDFIFRVIKPTLTDLRGTLWMLGTPGVVSQGYWWSVTRPDVENRARGWNVYTWHSFDNPFITEQFREDLIELRNIYHEELDTLPWFRREWLGEWCTDTSNNVYRYDPERNNIDSYAPEVDDAYILAVDPGYKDAAAFVVGCYNTRKSDRLVFVECYRKVGMQMSTMADKVMEYVRKYPKLQVIGDPDSAHFLALMREVYHLPIQDAQKVKKQENIEYMNNSLVAGKVQFLMPQCMDYGREIMELKKKFLASDQRLEGGVTLGDWTEAPKQPNDLCDCGLYIHRHARNYLYTSPRPKVIYGTAEYYEQMEDKLRQQAVKKLKGTDEWLPPP